MEDIYNNSRYLSQNPSWHQEDSPFKAECIQKILQDFHITYQSVCEVGCGSGEILKLLQESYPVKNCVYHGYDISAEALNIATGKSNANLNFYCEDFTKKNLAQPYDVLLIMDVIEHLRDYFTFLETIKPKGKYTVLHIPLDMFVWSLFREQMLLESKSRVGHIHNFTEDFIVSVLTDMGYRIIAKRYTEPDYKAESFKGKCVNFLKKALFKVSPRFCTKTLGGYSLLVLCEN
jgi:SAM-dependent methyltransferase